MIEMKLYQAFASNQTGGQILKQTENRKFETVVVVFEATWLSSRS